MTRFLGLVASLLSLTLISCSSVSLKPPGADTQAILILPVTAKNSSKQNFFGFYYVYDIVNVEDPEINAGVEFKLPLRQGYRLIDSLPPGRYRLDQVSFYPIGRGTRHYNENQFKRYETFSLHAGKITILESSLNVVKVNDPSGNFESRTLTNMNIDSVSTAQFVQIAEALGKSPNFGQWQIKYPVVGAIAALQGSWQGQGKTDSELSLTAAGCDLESTEFDVKGAVMRGRGRDADGKTVELYGLVSPRGTLKGEIVIDQQPPRRFWGRFDAGMFTGTYVGKFDCRGLLTLHQRPGDISTAEPAKPEAGTAPGVATTEIQKQDPPQQSKPRSLGRYLSSITSDSLYLFKKTYRSIEITLIRDGNRIVGFDDSGTLKIGGGITGDTIEFYLEPSIISGFYNVSGEWKMNADGTRMEGFWRDSRGDGPGDWNLIKID